MIFLVFRNFETFGFWMFGTPKHLFFWFLGFPRRAELVCWFPPEGQTGFSVFLVSAQGSNWFFWFLPGGRTGFLGFWFLRRGQTGFLVFWVQELVCGFYWFNKLFFLVSKIGFLLDSGQLVFLVCSVQLQVVANVSFKMSKSL